MDEFPAFVEAEGFAARWRKLGLTDDDLYALQMNIAIEPERYPIMPGTGGLRKIRFAGHSGQGKSGGHRICFAYFSSHGTVLLVTVYAKAEKANIGPAEKSALKALVEAFEAELESEG